MKEILLERDLVIVGARHVVATLLAEELALALVEAQAADGAIEHGLVFWHRFGVFG
jgi:hypothetical protein